jgi:hypothetical protein
MNYVWIWFDLVFYIFGGGDDSVCYFRVFFLIACLKYLFLFQSFIGGYIANSFVIIHPVFYTANHYDIDCLDIYSQSPQEFVPIREVDSWSGHLADILVGYSVGGSFLVAKEQWHIVKDYFGVRHVGLVIEVIDLVGNSISYVNLLVSRAVFFRFPIKAAKIYLIDRAIEADDIPVFASDLETYLRIDGLRDFPDELPMVISTHWIRMIQRTWKRIYAERMRRLRLRGSLIAQRRFEITGKYGIGIDGFGDGIRGMLRPLFVKSQQI